MVIDHTNNISKCNHLACSTYIKLPKKSDHPKKDLINILNTDDNEWCLFRYLNSEDHHPVKITIADKDFAKKLDFKDIDFPVKTRDIPKIE